MTGKTIGICGAGIGGLAAAALLTQRGHHVTLFDQFDAPQPVGSGLVIQPASMEVLDAIGAGEAVRAHGAPLTRMLGREVASGRRVLDVSYRPGANGTAPGGHGHGQTGLGIHRASLFDALLRAAQATGITVTQGHRATGLSSVNGAGRLHFAHGGSEGPFDLIVDASGAGSALSPLMARPLPYGAVWGTVDWPESSALPRDQLSQRYRRADRMAGILPIGTLPGGSTRKAAVFWSLPARGHDAWLDAGIEAWRDEACTLWPDMAPFLAQITSPDQMTMARYTHGTLQRPWRDGVALIGDAAHRASPQLGQGANMALLDAMALALALDRYPARHELPEALAAYGKGRRWHVRAYQMMSAAFTPQYQSDSRALPVLRDRVLFPLSQVPPIPRILSALVSGTLLPAFGSLQNRSR